MKKIVLAILAKDKAHVLPYFLKAIERQTWPKSRTILYIRTNNNNDETVMVLRHWLAMQTEYKEIVFDDSDVPEPVQDFGQHEWNPIRFKVLGAIRQASMDFARKRRAHYVVVDCDNILAPTTIAAMVESLNALGTGPSGVIISPLLHSTTNYSNYHAAIDTNGYCEGAAHYGMLLDRTIRGFVQVPVVHCTYAVHHNSIPLLSYDDGSGRYEYVIFSHSARSTGVHQYLDTREIYGHITFAENHEALVKEPWFSIYNPENLEPVFQRIYQQGEWTYGRFPKSGAGSTVDATQSYRELIQTWVDRSERIVDLGCGDWTFSQHIDWKGRHYIGLDVVSDLIAQHNVHFAEPNIQFYTLDFAHNPEQIPKGDLFIIKDVLQHWPDQLITEFLTELVKRKKPILITNCTANEKMDDVPIGGFRPLSPSHFPLKAFNPQILHRYATKVVCVINP